MIFDNPIKLYTTTIQQGTEYLMGLMNELNLFEHCAFDNMEYIYEVCYKDGIKVVNRSVKNYRASRSGLASHLTEEKSLKKVKDLKDLEEYLKSFKGLPQNFMQNDKFSVVSNGVFREVEITFTNPEIVDFNNIESHINKKNIEDIKFFYHNNVCSVHFDNCGIIETTVSTAKIDDICNTSFEIIDVNGVYRNNKLEICHIILRVGNDGFIDIINGYASDIIISYHIIDKEDHRRIKERIDEGEKVESAICLREYDGDIMIYDTDFDYKHFIYMENSNLQVADTDLVDEIDESDPDYLFWQNVDNRMEK